jgi:hypothetical protein
MNIDATQRMMRVFLVGVLAGSVSAGLSGCAKWKERRAERRARNAAQAERPAARPIVLDGQFDDWPTGAATVADQDSIYFRVTVEDGGSLAQASSDQFSLWLDVDNNVATGSAFADVPHAAGMGIDLIIENLPTDPATGIAEVYAVGVDGTRTRLTPEQIGLQSARSTRSNAFELRISRQIEPATAPTLAPLLRAAGAGRGTFVLHDGTGKVVGWSDPERFTKPVVTSVAAP